MSEAFPFRNDEGAEKPTMLDVLREQAAGEGKPEPGSLVLCAYCGALYSVDDAFAYQLLATDERDRLARALTPRQRLADGVEPVVGIDRDADTGRDGHFVAAQVERVAQRIANLVDHGQRRLRPFRQHQDGGEFVAAKACDGVAFAHAGRQACGHLGQELVAHVVAEGVIEGLEIIEVQEQQRTVPSASGAGGHRLLDDDGAAGDDHLVERAGRAGAAGH